MALVLANRVQESATANTTVSFTLTGAVAGFQTFAVIGDTNTTYYSATDTSGNWEVGLGTYSTTGPTLTRTTIYASSNSGSAVTFSGTVSVFVTYPSGKSVNLDGSGNVSALGTVASGTWQGSTIGVAYGGTGVTASTGPNSVVLRDANENITVNRLNQGLQTITASGGTTVLTAASDFNQALVGTGNQTFQLPDATTLTDTTTFQFNNNATGTLTITDYASATVGTVASGGAAGIALLNNATVGGTWDVHAYIPENVTWGTNSLYLNSTIVTGGTWQGGTIQPAYGGTGLTTFVGANNALYSTGSTTLTAGTLPAVAGGTGLSTYTLGDFIYSSATNTLTKLPGNTTTTKKFLSQTGTGSASAAPVWDTVDAANISGGSANQILYQSGASTTAFATAPSATGQLLNWNGSSFVWTLTPSVTSITTSDDSTISGLTVGHGGGGGSSTNTALGVNALAANTSTNNLCTAVGYGALQLNTTGPSNTAVGYMAGSKITGSNGNLVAVGASAARNNTSGGAITAIGTGALYTNTTGDSNTAVGYNALTSISTSSGSTGVGRQALSGTTGGGNTAIGSYAGRLITTGTNNTVIGSYLGDTAPISATGSNYIVLSDGAGTVRQVIDGSGNVGFGTLAPGSRLDVQGTLRLSGSTSGYVGLAPAAAAGSTTYTLPSADGTAGQVLSTNGSAVLSWSSAAGSTITNDTTTSTNIYPLLGTATSGTLSAVNTSDAKLLYKPSTGDLQSSAVTASNGIFVNAATVTSSYTVASGNNASSAGPLLVDSGVTVTVASGGRWVIV